MKTKKIGTSDPDGVTLAAIQGLNIVAKEKDARFATLEKNVAELNVTVQSLVRKRPVN